MSKLWVHGRKKLTLPKRRRKKNFHNKSVFLEGAVMTQGNWDSDKNFAG
ncbi:hypothetical protein WD_0293 [Wolbachia endosymbiont of Drosophila melanogaster]|nr:MULTISPECIES: hypothetical protein [Wolbachia]AAS14029.1 hypothetical protein WD_0293 [Wolbachia endosymbiont of Drosophila melanogaster]ERN55928.1 hypothetical protein WMELPOP_02093 [Wolbachia pipientis wMelPop]MBA8752988.1 hypothetical protein [Wolbachia pipientis]UID81783.1 hypothetical protein J4T77_03185 [Wolbachia endosymbiont of Drosophila innubila]UID81801.1 hypothetical protein J4T77_03390 [Wolbachia endosymbiont of Drosophila innubila]